jgi:putative transposase
MIKSLRMRILPNQEQEQLLWKHTNASRFIWNWGLAYQENLFKIGEKHLSGYSLKKVLTQLKQQEDYKWLNDVSSQTLSNTILDLDSAYKRFFNKVSGRPKFKKKSKVKPKFPVRCDSFYFINNCVNIEKIGKIKFQTNYNLPQGKNVCKFSNPRICYENNKWILSFGIECNNQAFELNDFSIGIDLGIKKLAVVSFEDKSLVFKNINKTKRVKNLKRKLKHLQRKVSRKYHTNNKNNTYESKWFKSNNILKTEEQIRKIYAKISNIRKNYNHQTTHTLVSLLPKRVVMEDLNVSGMMKNRHLSKAIQEQCFYEFIRQMKYKCEWLGIEFIQADRFYPSSKTCNHCGNIKKDLKLSDRTYICEHCGFTIDRDLNAAMNLANYSKV